MFYKEYLPHPTLSRYIHLYGSVRIEGGLLEPITERIPPILGRGLIFHFSEDDFSGSVMNHLGKYELPSGYVLPLFTGSILATYQGAIDMFAIIFKPGQFNRFFDSPITDLVDQHGTFQEVDLKEIDRLHDKLRNVETLVDKVAEADQFFLKKLKHISTQQSLTDHFIASLAQIGVDNNIRIEAIAEEVSILSKRQFRRRIQAELGVAPKTFYNIYRFNRAFQLLKQSPNLSLSTIAYTAGYSDQSHFGRDFKKFLGLSPNQFLDANTPFTNSRYWRDDVVDGFELHV